VQDTPLGGRRVFSPEAFDMDQGGALCRTCRTGAPLGEDALELMRMILGGRLNDALAAPPSKVTHEVMAHATRALEHHIERRLRSVALFESAGFERVDRS
jgi:DNA repair protein RecO (recombination protein O)